MPEESPTNSEASEQFDAPDMIRLKRFANESADSHKLAAAAQEAVSEIAQDDSDGTKADWTIFEQNFRELCISLAAFFLIPGIESISRLVGYENLSGVIPLLAVMLNILWMLKCSVFLTICSHGESVQRRSIRSKGGLLISGTFASFLFGHFLIALFTGQFESNKWNIWYEAALALIFGPILLFFALRSSKWFATNPGSDVFGLIFCSPYILVGLQLLMGPGFVARFLLHPMGGWLVGFSMLWHIIGSFLCLGSRERLVHILLFCFFSMPMIFVAMMGPTIITIFTMH